MAGASPPILITFAIPQESSEFCRIHDHKTCRVVHTGIGLKSAAERVKAALQQTHPAYVVSAGFAGGLDPQLSVGDMVVDSSRSDPALLERLPLSAIRGSFLSVDEPLETVRAKAATFQKTAALSVDMETDAIATTCAEAGVPALFIRSISDAAGDLIPLPFATSYDMARQRPRPLAVCLYLLASPSRIAPFARFLRDLRVARVALTRTLVGFVADHR